MPWDQRAGSSSSAKARTSAIRGDSAAAPGFGDHHVHDHGDRVKARIADGSEVHAGDLSELDHLRSRLFRDPRALWPHGGLTPL